MEVVLKPTIRTNMHICVPVLILCPILGLIWVLSLYISSAKGVILVYIRTNMNICVPVLILCPIIGLIWVFSWDIPTPRVLSSYIPCVRVGISQENIHGVGISQENTRIEKYLAGIKNFTLRQKHTHPSGAKKNKKKK